MTEGFKCDKCGKFLIDDPWARIFFEGTGKETHSELHKHLCKSCSRKLYDELKKNR